MDDEWYEDCGKEGCPFARVVERPVTKTKRFEGSVNDHAGVNVALHWPADDVLALITTPRCAEVYSDDQKEYAEIGLEWENNKLTGYDGVFSLPVQVMDFLDELGFDTQEMRQSLKDPGT